MIREILAAIFLVSLAISELAGRGKLVERHFIILFYSLMRGGKLELELTTFNAELQNNVHAQLAIRYTPSLLAEIISIAGNTFFMTAIFHEIIKNNKTSPYNTET